MSNHKSLVAVCISIAICAMRVKKQKASSAAKGLYVSSSAAPLEHDGMLLKGLTFCIAGTLSKARKEVETEIKEYGGDVTSSVTGKVTHLLCTPSVYEGRTSNFEAFHVAVAQGKGIPIVKEQFLLDAIKDKKVPPIDEYTFQDTNESGGSKAKAIDSVGHTWEYYVDKPVDGKTIGWYPYDPASVDNMERFYNQFQANPDMGNRWVYSGMWTYEAGFGPMQQPNADHQKTKRQIRRVLE